MKLAELPAEFIKSLPLISVLETGGHEAYFVGGSVRDSLLGQPIHDVDIATSAYPAEVKELFPRTIDLGIDHGTVLVLLGDDEYEVTTFRTESTYQDFRRPDEVTFVKSLAEDLRRRDFTINALAMDKDGQIIDLFAGQVDLDKCLIRAVGQASERFSEDALRMMRALRFASQLDFEIEADTLEAIQEHHALLGKVSIERIRIEYLKLMLGKNRAKGLVPFVATKCYLACPGFEHAKENLEKLSQLEAHPLAEEAQVWLITAAYLQLDEDETRKLLRRWKNSRQMITRVAALLSGLRYRLTHEWSPKELFALGKDNACLIEDSLRYFGKTGEVQAVLSAYESLPLQTMQDLAITGKELLPLKNNRGGPWVGDILEVLKEAVLNEALKNERADLLQFAATYLAKEEQKG